MTKKVVLVVTNVDSYDAPHHPTGLWLSELTHAYDTFATTGYDQTIVSPRGGRSPLEPRSLKWPSYDASARAWHHDQARMAMLADTRRPDEIEAADYDAIYFTGGHAVMWDFPEDEGLQALTRDIWEQGGVVAAVCHGYVALLNTALSDGSRLVDGRTVTGFTWREEILARVDKLVPFNAEEEMRARGARFEKNVIPFTSRVVTDGRLVTGQNPQSAKATAKAVVEVLEGMDVDGRP